MKHSTTNRERKSNATRSYDINHENTKGSGRVRRLVRMASHGGLRLHCAGSHNDVSAATGQSYFGRTVDEGMRTRVMLYLVKTKRRLARALESRLRIMGYNTAGNSTL